MLDDAAEVFTIKSELSFKTELSQLVKFFLALSAICKLSLSGVALGFTGFAEGAFTRFIGTSRGQAKRRTLFYWSIGKDESDVFLSYVPISVEVVTMALGK